MKNKLSLLVMVALFCMISCNKEDLIAFPETDFSNQEVGVIDGYLNFATTQSFEEYINSLIDEATSQNKVKASNSFIPIENSENFISISQRKERLYRTKSTNMYEMTKEEYELMLAENLLLDPILTNVVDTNLMIGVENRLYKITDFGTFSIDAAQRDLLPSIINEFDKSLINQLGKGETINLSASATFTNTFGEESVTDEILMINDLPQEIEETKGVVNSGVFKNNFHLSYGTTDYQWSNNSIFLKFIDLIRGKSVNKCENFDSNHRVKVSLFDVNYLFYATTGIKCEMQTQKNFLFVKYWVSDYAEDIAIGFNKLSGELMMNNPISYSNLATKGVKNWTTFSSNIDNISSSFSFANTGINLMKEWSNDLTVFVPSLDFYGKNCLNFSTLSDLYKADTDEVFNWLKNQAGKSSINLITGQKKTIEQKDPRVLLFVLGNSITSYNREKPFVMGVKTYGRSSSQVVRMDSSFGFTLNVSIPNGGPTLSGFLPTEFDIHQVDAFGAAKFGGKWKGVRFVYK